MSDIHDIDYAPWSAEEETKILKLCQAAEMDYAKVSGLICYSNHF
jgi:hypothetical protein